MQTFIDRDIEQGCQAGIHQGQRLGEATALLRQIERKLGPPSDAVRERVLAADSETPLEWLDRILVADSVETSRARSRCPPPHLQASGAGRRRCNLRIRIRDLAALQQACPLAILTTEKRL